jgi:Protein of unknown function (DUF2917)
MREYLVQGSIPLARGSLLRIEDGRGILIYVWEGELWLTEDGERRDRFLHQGEWHRLARGGEAIAQAFERSLVTLTAPRPTEFARRIVLQKAGGAPALELYNAARERSRDIRLRLRRAWAAIAGPGATGASF